VDGIFAGMKITCFVFGILALVVGALPTTLSAAADSTSTWNGDYHCSVKYRDKEYGYQYQHRFSLKIEQGVVKQFTASQNARSSGDEQACLLDLAALKQIKVPDGIALSSGPKEGEGGTCTVKISKSGESLSVQFGDPNEADNDCRSSSQEMFCSPRGYWAGLTLNTRTHQCKLSQ